MTVFRTEARPPFRDVLGRFDKATEEMKEEKRVMIRGLGRRFVAIAREEAPKKTGKFASGIRFRTYVQGDRVGFTSSTPQPLGKFIIEGTKPHAIEPKGPGYPLRFFWEKIGKVVFTYHVNHPGTKPNPFIERAKDRWLPESRRELNRIARDWVADVRR